MIGINFSQWGWSVGLELFLFAWGRRLKIWRGGNPEKKESLETKNFQPVAQRFPKNLEIKTCPNYSYRNGINQANDFFN